MEARLSHRQWVIGLHWNGVCPAYPANELEKAGGLVRDRTGDQEVLVQHLPADGLFIVRDVRGEVVPAIAGYWFVRHACHPETGLYRS